MAETTTRYAVTRRAEGNRLQTLLANWRRIAWRFAPSDHSALQRWETDGGHLAKA
jgi:hypothetical protein